MTRLELPHNAEKSACSMCQLGPVLLTPVAVRKGRLGQAAGSPRAGEHQESVPADQQDWRLLLLCTRPILGGVGS